MSDKTMIEVASSPRSGAVRLRAPLTLVLALWPMLVAVLGARGWFVTADGVPPWPVGVAVAMPIALFLFAFRQSAALREFLLALDPGFILAIQAWRFTGLAFVALYAYRVLPGLFAWPAGLGDLAIGISAPWMLLALNRRPGLAYGRALALWNVLGLLDLVVAVGTGVLSQFLGAADGQISTQPMAQLPLVFVPAFLVPLFAMLHLTMLAHARARAVAPLYGVESGGAQTGSTNRVDDRHETLHGENGPQRLGA